MLARAGPSTEDATKEDEQVTFKYNPAMQRWEKKKGGYKDGRKGNVESLITPLAGAAYTVWPVIHEELTQAGLESLPAAEVYRLQQEEGALLVDCRVDWNFEQEHAEGAVSLPLFRGVTGNDFYATLKRLAMGSFAMKATERDPDYQKTALERLDKNQKIIMMCSIGGTIKTGTQPWGDPSNPSRKAQKKFDDPERAFGRESRSLKACHELIKISGLFMNTKPLDRASDQDVALLSSSHLEGSIF
ncbi:hypothetical protein WJX84_011789 [Apatococcus fuscideae]|uniref:Rhodanese domain-containing protein n=1 Tax=Apatococcus fuscideae TaxID=2026836 RepID=A0AAW1SVH2_9CHLO